MPAYDYVKQEWVTDPAKAVELQVSQLKEDLALVESDAGQKYLDMINVKLSPANYAELLRAKIAAVEVSL